MRSAGKVRRRWGAGIFATVLAVSGSGAALVTVTSAGPAGATSVIGPVDPSIPSGDPGSLWYVIENDVSDGDTVVLQAGATYLLDNCNDPDIDIEYAITIQGNGATIAMGCLTTEEVLDVDASGTVWIDGVTVTRAPGMGGGPGIYGGADVLRITNSAIVDNINCDFNGGGITFSASEGSELWVVNSTIAGNHTVYDGGGIASDEGRTSINVVNSTISTNTANYVGGIEQDSGDVSLVYSDVVDNSTGVAEPALCSQIDSNAAASDDDGDVKHAGDEARVEDEGEPANVRIEEATEGSALYAFGSVVAYPHGGLNCGDDPDVLTNTVSGGYNFADDTSCGFAEATDTQGSGPGFDPLLAALASNGGLGQTRLPDAGSPLIDAIPNASCGGGDALAGEAITSDERLLPRPSPTGGACDIGAVEIQVAAPPPPLELQPSFTG